MMVILARRTEDAGQRPLPKDVARLRAKSYVDHMTALGITPDKYNEVYERAVLIYNSKEINGPFGVDHMIQAAKSVQETRIKYKTYSKPERKAMVSCTTCQGSKISYKMDGNKVIGINRNADGSVKKCEDCAE